MYGTFAVEVLSEIDIFTVDINSQNLVQVVVLIGDDLYSSLSFDVKKILFASQESGNYVIWMIATSEVSEPPPY